MKMLSGEVISLKMKDTAVVLVEYTTVHPKYKKIMKRSTKIKAHNTLPDVQVGSVVTIIPSRPVSKEKHFLVKEIVSQPVSKKAGEPEAVELIAETKKSNDVKAEKRVKRKTVSKKKTDKEIT